MVPVGGGFSGLERVGGGCGERLGLRGERGEMQPDTISETETSDDYIDYIAVIYLTVGQSSRLRMRRNLAGSLSTL